jgi:hypothetical protein
MVARFAGGGPTSPGGTNAEAGDPEIFWTSTAEVWSKPTIGNQPILSRWGFIYEARSR